MTLILNIETATTVCSVSLAKDGEVLAYREQNDGYSHAEMVSPFINEIMDELKLEAKDLDAVAVSEGPGSYTGLRIGVSTAKGLCFALDIPLIAVSSLQSMALEAAQKHADHDVFVPMIDARRMEVYTHQFDGDNKALTEIEAKVLDESSYKDELLTKRLLLCGDGSAKCKDLLVSENCTIDDSILPSSRSMASLSYRKFKAEEFVDTAYFEPFYLKDFVAGVPKVKGLR